MALEARPGAERGDRHAPRLCEREHGRDLGGRARVDDHVGTARPVERDVLGVEVALGVPCRDAGLVANRLGERRAQLVRVHFSRGCQANRFAATR